MRKRRKTSAHKAVEKKRRSVSKIREEPDGKDGIFTAMGRSPHTGAAMSAELQAMVSAMHSTPLRGAMSEEFPMSQAEQPCDVGWDSNSPITMTQVSRINRQGDGDLKDFVKKCMDEGNAMPSCTPPLLGLWMESPGQEISPTKTVKEAPLVRCPRRSKRGRPTGIKAAIGSKELLMRLQSVIEGQNSTSSSEEKDETDKKRLSFKDIQVCNNSTTPSEVHAIESDEMPGELDPADKENEPLMEEKDTTAEVICDEEVNTLNPKLQVPSAQLVLHSLESSRGKRSCAFSAGSISTALNTTDIMFSTKPNNIARECDQAILIPHLKATKLVPPESVPANKVEGNQSCSDLWTDDELFDDDSFVIKATQDLCTPDALLSPKILNNTGKTSTTATKKSGRYTFSLGKSPIPYNKITTESDFKAEVRFSSHNHLEANPQPSVPASASDTMFKKPQIQPQKSVAVHQSYYTRNNAVARTTKISSRQQGMEDVSLSQCSQIVGSSQMQPKQFPSFSAKSNLVGQEGNNAKSLQRNSTNTSVTKSIPVGAPNDVIKFNGLPTSHDNAILPAGSKNIFSKKELSSSSMGRFTVTDNIVQHVSTTVSRFKPPVSNKKSSSGMKPCTNNSANRNSTMTGVIHSKVPTAANFVSRGVPSSVKSVIEMSDINNTSITDDILASLAEPDEILDSQVASDNKDDNDLFDEIWLDMAIIPPTAELISNSVISNKPLTTAVESAKLESNAEVPDYCSVAIKQANYADTKNLNETFPSDDDALSEMQLLEMLDETEIKASQALSNISSSESVVPKTSIVQQVVPLPLPAEPKSSMRPSSQKSKNSTSPLDSTAGSAVFSRRSSSEQISGSQGSVRSISPSSLTDGSTRPSSQESTASSILDKNQKYSLEDIERKKMEAVQRRQNKLKLPKTSGAKKSN